MKSSLNRLGTHLYLCGQITLLHVYQTCTHFIPIVCMKYASKCLFDVHTILILCERDCLWVLLISSDIFVIKVTVGGLCTYSHNISQISVSSSLWQHVFFLFFLFFFFCHSVSFQFSDSYLLFMKFLFSLSLFCILP